MLLWKGLWVMFERAVSVSEVSGCPPHHNAKPQGVSVHLHFQLPTHNPASYSIGIWKNTVIMGTLCQGCSFVMFHIIHSCAVYWNPQKSGPGRRAGYTGTLQTDLKYSTGESRARALIQPFCGVMWGVTETHTPFSPHILHLDFPFSDFHLR